MLSSASSGVAFAPFLRKGRGKYSSLLMVTVVVILLTVCGAGILRTLHQTPPVYGPRELGQKIGGPPSPSHELRVGDGPPAGKVIAAGMNTVNVGGEQQQQHASTPLSAEADEHQQQLDRIKLDIGAFRFSGVGRRSSLSTTSNVSLNSSSSPSPSGNMMSNSSIPIEKGLLTTTAAPPREPTGTSVPQLVSMVERRRQAREAAKKNMTTSSNTSAVKNKNGRVLPPGGLPDFWKRQPTVDLFATIDDTTPLVSPILLDSVTGEYVSRPQRADGGGGSDEREPLRETVAGCGARQRHASGSDSTVWLTFDVPPIWADRVGGMLNVEATRDSAKLHLLRAMADAPAFDDSLYHRFFDAYNASIVMEDFVHTEGGGVSSSFVPLQFDVVYTYVNDSSPSHLRWTASATPPPLSPLVRANGRQNSLEKFHQRQSNHSDGNVTASPLNGSALHGNGNASVGVSTSNISSHLSIRKSLQQQAQQRRIFHPPQNAGTAASRFRDWNELIYSMRALYRYGVCGSSSPALELSNATTTATAAQDRAALDQLQQPQAEKHRPAAAVSQEEASALSRIRTIYIVVADNDQAPSWLSEKITSTLGHEGSRGAGRNDDASHQKQPQVRIVTHKDIFPESDQPFLPTFNSHAIESVLHRIPGIGRYFVYFNNDMFWTRPMSWFDYFRPISNARQQHLVHRLNPERLAAWMTATASRGNTAGAAAAGGDTSDIPSLRSHGVHLVASPQGGGPPRARVAFALEPILYFEGNEDVHECRAWPKQDANTSAAAAVADTASHSPGGPPLVATMPSLKTAPPQPQQTGHPPSSALPTTPEYDRSVFGARVALESLLKHSTCGSIDETGARPPISEARVEPGNMLDFQCPQRGTPSSRRLRGDNSLWRQFVDYNKAVVFRRLAGAHWPTHTFAHIPRLMDRVLAETMLDDVFADIAQSTRRSRTRSKTSLWTTHVYQWFALAERRLVEEPLRVAITAADSPNRWRPPQLGDAAVSMADLRPLGNEELDNKRIEHAALRFAVSDIELEIIRDAHYIEPTQPPLKPRSINSDAPASVESVARTASSKWRQQALIERTSGTSFLEEKLNHHVVRLDKKKGGYYFCMMRTLASQAQCRMETVQSRELLGGVQFFVTVNDDLPRMIPNELLFQRAWAGARRLLDGLAGHAKPAPWEQNLDESDGAQQQCPRAPLANR